MLTAAIPDNGLQPCLTLRRIRSSLRSAITATAELLV